MTLPNFLMVGAAKSGTSALYAYLRQHPDIFLSDVRECEFFALEGRPLQFTGPGDAVAFRRYITELDRYRTLFRGVRGQRAIGECSDLYLYSREAAQRIRRLIPGARLLVLLRNPVDRAFSHFLQFVRDGREPLGSFEAALAAEPERVSAGWHPHWFLKARGLYAAQLRVYYDLFPKEQIAVHLYDDFQRDSAGVARRLFAFLGVDESFSPDTSLRYNISGVPRSRLLHAILARPLAVKDVIKPLLPAALRHRLRVQLMNRNLKPEKSRMTPATRAALTEDFREDILRLQDLIQRDLSSWLTTKS